MRASLRRIWVQLTADRRRFGVLCGTCAVGLLLWARLIIVSNVSRTAMADDGAAAAKAAPNKSGPAAADKPTDRGSAGVAPALDIRLWERCERDPFVISRLHFPKASALPEVKQEAGKLPTEPAEDLSQKEARLVARLRELLGSVRLEAAMGNSMAIIGGRRYVVGDRLPAMGNERVEFTLAEIRQRSVVLDHQGRRFELEMSVPGTSGNQG